MTPLLRLALLAAATLLPASFALAQAAHEPMAKPMPASKPAVVSTTLTVTANGKSVTYTAAELEAMPQRTVTVHSMHSGPDDVYLGVSLDDLLLKSGFTVKGDGAQTVYHSYVRAEGTDHYFVLFSMTELESAVQSGEAIVALKLGGKPLGDQGAFKLVLAGEKRPSRWVHNLNSLTIVTVQ